MTSPPSTSMAPDRRTSPDRTPYPRPRRPGSDATYDRDQAGRGHSSADRAVHRPDRRFVSAFDRAVLWLGAIRSGTSTRRIAVHDQGDDQPEAASPSWAPGATHIALLEDEHFAAVSG